MADYYEIAKRLARYHSCPCYWCGERYPTREAYGQACCETCYERLASEDTQEDRADERSEALRGP